MGSNDQLDIFRENQRLHLRIAELESKLKLAERVQSKHEVIQMFRERTDGSVYPGAALDAHWAAAARAQEQQDALLLERYAAFETTIFEIKVTLYFLMGAAWISRKETLRQALCDYEIPYKKEDGEPLQFEEYLLVLFKRLTSLSEELGTPVRANGAWLAAIVKAVAAARIGGGGGLLREAVTKAAIDHMQEVYDSNKGGRPENEILDRVGKVVCDLRKSKPTVVRKHMREYVLVRLQANGDAEAYGLVKNYDKAKIINWLRAQEVRWKGKSARN